MRYVRDFIAHWSDCDVCDRSLWLLCGLAHDDL